MNKLLLGGVGLALALGTATAGAAVLVLPAWGLREIGQKETNTNKREITYIGATVVAGPGWVRRLGNF